MCSCPFKEGDIIVCIHQEGGAFYRNGDTFKVLKCDSTFGIKVRNKYYNPYEPNWNHFADIKEVRKNKINNIENESKRGFDSRNSY